MKIGQRVQLHPHFDDWMRGDRYGTVIKITKQHIYVKLDVSKYIRKLTLDDVDYVD